MNLYKGTIRSGVMNWNPSPVRMDTIKTIEVVAGDTVSYDEKVLYKGLEKADRRDFENEIADKVDVDGRDSLVGYLKGVTHLGWLNIAGPVLNYSASKKAEGHDYSVNRNSTTPTIIVMTFKGIESMLNAKVKNDKAIFSSVPKGRDVKIIGIRYDDGKPAMTVKNTSIGEEVRLDGYRQFTLEGLKKELNSVGS